VYRNGFEGAYVATHHVVSRNMDTLMTLAEDRRWPSRVECERRAVGEKGGVTDTKKKSKIAGVSIRLTPMT